MSCCTVKKENKSNQYLEILKKNFDEIEIEQKEKYQLLTLKKKPHKDNYDWIVWLQLKIAYANTNNCTRSSDEKLEGVMQNICDWLPLLKDFDKSSKPKQLNLFGEEEESELEQEPEMPSGNDNAWGKYFRECARVRKSNLMKQYNFFDLFHDAGEWWCYDDIDYSRLLPKTDSEMIELAKEYLSGNIHSDILKGNNPFEDEYHMFETPSSDIELYHNIICHLRFGLIPYRDFFHVSTDMSYSSWEIEEKISHKLMLRLGKIETNSWDNKKYPQYNFKNPDFLMWVRNYFDIPYVEPVSDEYVLKHNIEAFIDSMLWYGRHKYDFKNRINTFKNWKEFKADIISFMKKEGINMHNGGGSGFQIDGFNGRLNLSEKGNILITQNLEDRLEMNRQIEGLEAEDSGKLIVYDISGDEIYKKAFELFNQKEAANKISLFDFVA